ncbi:hypothetical protein ACH49_16040 [Streptomyces leeuwenhoekii]|uniref:Uncharacterized protein n=1 Tax=Streptomyces leeuwenhoekii TaxID=1437453 RepID=A0ABR5HXH9_STRLW|nr:hypothetical protein ACH49_16040 [Streptomyces leeuwenhoekii]
MSRWITYAPPAMSTRNAAIVMAVIMAFTARRSAEREKRSGEVDPRSHRRAGAVTWWSRW